MLLILIESLVTRVPFYLSKILRRHFPYQVASREKGEVKMSLVKAGNSIKSDKLESDDEPVRVKIAIVTGVTGQVSLLMVMMKELNYLSLEEPLRHHKLHPSVTDPVDYFPSPCETLAVHVPG